MLKKDKWPVEDVTLLMKTNHSSRGRGVLDLWKKTRGYFELEKITKEYGTTGKRPLRRTMPSNYDSMKRCSQNFRSFWRPASLSTENLIVNSSFEDLIFVR